MQLGTRWTVGDATPGGLPAALIEAVAAVEAELAAEGVDASTWRWTLTWLEGRPVAQLDDGTTLRARPDGSIERSQADQQDD